MPAKIPKPTIPVGEFSTKNGFLEILGKTIKQNTSNLGRKKTQKIPTAESKQSNDVQKYLKDYLLAVAKTGCSSSTVRNYKSDIKQFLDFLENPDLNDLRNKPKLLAFAHYQRDKGLKASSVQRKLVSISQFKIWLKQQGLLVSEIPLNSLPTNFEENEKEALNDALERKIIDQGKAKVIETAPEKANERRTEDKINVKNTPKKAKRSHSRLMIVLNLLALFVFLGGLAYFAYQQFGQAIISMASPNTPVAPNRILSYQGRLTNTSQSPISAPTAMTYALYNADEDGDLLWSSNTCTIDPDQDGIFNTNLGAGVGDGSDDEDCGGTISEEVFTENANVWLEVAIGAEILTPRQPIRTVAYAINSSTLRGLAPAEVATNGTILMMNSDGEVVLGTDNPVVKAASTSSGMTIEANQITIQTRAGSNGNIVLAPDGTGIVDIQSDASVSGTSTLIGNVYLSSPNSLIFSGTTALGEISSPTDSGAYLIGTYDEFSNSSSTNVQGVLNDLDAAIVSAGTPKWSNLIAPTSNLSLNHSTYTTNFNWATGTGANNLFSLTTDTGSNGTGSLLNLQTGTGSTVSPLRVRAGSTEALFVNNSGNVGIGTTNPSAKLHVAGDMRLTGGFYDASNSVGTSGQVLSSTGTGTAWTSLSGLSVGNADTVDNYHVSGSANYVSKFNSSNNSLTNSLIYDNGTNVGIGTANPGSYKLNVSGNAIVNNLYFANPGIGSGSRLAFLKTNDNAWINVTETSNDATTYGFYMSDNPDTTSDKFIWDIADYKGAGGDWTPLEFSNLNANIRAANVNSYGDYNVYGPWYSADGQPNAVTESKTGTLTVTPNVSGFTGSSYRLYVIEIDGAGSPNTFKWCANTGINSCTSPVQSGVAITGGAQALDTGVYITFNSTTGGVVGDKYQFRVYKGGHVLASNGSVTAPTFSFINDSNTGMYLGETDNLRLTTAGSDRVTINSTGNVGIGTTDPSAKLHISGDIRLTGGFYDASNNIGTAGQILSSTGTGTSWVDTSTISTNFWQRTAGSLAPLNVTDDLNLGAIATASAIVHLPGRTNQNAWLNLGTGKLGIGTTNPGSKLTVQATTANEAAFALYDNLGNSNFEIRSTASTLANTYVGQSAGAANTSGYNNTALGYQALKSNTTGAHNTALGYNTLNNNISGNYNTAIGTSLLTTNSSGSYNIAMGFESMTRNTEGYNNQAFGYQALYYNTTGAYNLAIGDNTLFRNTTGYSNTALGYGSMYNNLTGIYNTAVGDFALYNTTASYNTGIGLNAGKSVTSGQTNTFLGYDAGNNAAQLATAVNSMALGSGAYTTASNQVVLGNASIATTILRGKVGIGTTNPIYSLDVSGDINLTGALRANGDAGTSGYVLTSTGGGTNAWVDPSTLSTENFWQRTAGSLAPLNVTDDLNLGATATASAVVHLPGRTNQNAWLNLGTGKLGIGTTAPSALLTLKSTAANESATLGSELLSSSGWTSTGWTGDFTAGFDHTTGNTTALTNTLAAVVNNYYQIAYTVTGRTAGSFTVAFGGQSRAGISATGTFGPKATTTDSLVITPTSDFDGTIVLSIKQITGTYSPTFALVDSTNASSFEIRNSLGSLNNTFVGKNAGRYNTTGDTNLAVGANALYNNTTGTRNSALGYAALYNNTTGVYNSAVGYGALYNNTTGNYNSAVGQAALYSNTTGYYNSALGVNALYSNTTGNNNSALGLEAGRYISGGGANETSNNSLYLGYDSRALASGDTNEIVIGASAVGNGSNSVTLGNDSITKTILKGNVGIGTTAPSQKLTVNGTTEIKGDLYTGGSAFEHGISGSGNRYSYIDFHGDDTYTDYGLRIIRNNGGANTDSVIHNRGTGTIYIQAESAGVYLTSGATAWTANSDSRLKNVTSGFSNALESIAQLNPVHFTWKSDETNTSQVGLIAQDVQKVLPEAVSIGENGYLGVRYTDLIPLLVAGIQEQQTQIVALQVADLSLDQFGEIILTGTSANTYAVSTPVGVADRFSVFAGLAAAQIKAGLLEAQELATQVLTATTATITNLTATVLQATTATIANLTAPNLETETITSSDGQLAIVADTQVSGDLTVQESLTVAQDLTVTGQSKLGALIAQDATITGTLIAQQLLTETATVSGELTAEQIRVNELEANSARINAIETKLATIENATIENATVSGTLYAENIETNSISANVISGLQERLSEQIAETLTQPTLLATLFEQKTTQTDEYLNQLSQEINGEASTSADIASSSATLAELDANSEDLTLLADNAFINQYFEVNGNASIANSLKLGQNLLIGNNTILGTDYLSYSPTDETGTVISDFTFYIQPAGLGKISLLAGLMQLDGQGFVTISGDLKVAGVLEVADDLKVKGTLLTTLIGAENPGESIQVQLASVQTSTDSATIGGGDVQESNFEFVDENQTPVATFSANGDLALTGSLRLGQNASQTADTTSESEQLTTGRSAGQATLPAGSTEVTIRSDKLEANSMIYVTPMNSTNNQVLYVKDKVVDDSSTLENGATAKSFTVAIDSALEQDITFNWWLVQLN